MPVAPDHRCNRMNRPMLSDRTADLWTTERDLAEGRWQRMPEPVLSRPPLHSPSIGLLELSTEVVMAREILAFLPATAGVYAGRMEFNDAADIAGLTAVSEVIPAAADLLPGAEWLHAIVYGCTSGTIVLGEQKVRDLIGITRPDVPVVTPIGSVLKALKALKVRRLAVVTPYVDEVNALVARTLTDAGMKIVSARTLGQLTGAQMYLTPPDVFLEAALAADTSEADALFISCTGIAVSPILKKLEDRIGKPVVSSNQAIAWECCQRAGTAADLNRHGRLFSQPLPE
ncbi:UNVERIFIED_ORG: aspartate/glutamate racemase family protein (plasmid) [Roseateles sp. XES5]|nr:aspartate/glutamate racemase family protein [Roseateles sp. XES5]